MLAEEAKAPQKIDAIRYLGRMGCTKCYPCVEEGLLAALDDCTEEVRFEAAKAIRRTATETCHCCSYTKCCSQKIFEKLNKVAFETRDDGCPVEPSARVRRMARQALAMCGSPTGTPEEPTPAEGPSGAMPQPLPPPEGPPAETPPGEAPPPAAAPPAAAAPTTTPPAAARPVAAAAGQTSASTAQPSPPLVAPAAAAATNAPPAIKVATHPPADGTIVFGNAGASNNAATRRPAGNAIVVTDASAAVTPPASPPRAPQR
jgi:hypothetical protein